jgi:hypothetical protein
MNRIVKKNIIVVLSLATVLGYSCKDEPTKDPEPAKTLNKELLLNKKWYAKSGHAHIFNSDGVYGSSPTGGGSWKWLNNSDSMEIIEYTGAVKKIWYFNYCTEHEMECKLGKYSVGWALYKDEKW